MRKDIKSKLVKGDNSMKKYNRIFTIVIDSLGIGAMEDAKQYGDIDVDTLGHIAESVESLNIPNLQKMGIANLHKINLKKILCLNFFE